MYSRTVCINGREPTANVRTLASQGARMSKAHYYALVSLGLWNAEASRYLIEPDYFSMTLVFVSQIVFWMCQVIVWTNPDSWGAKERD